MLEKQKNSLENIYNEFIKQQKEALENFIGAFSNEINDFYQFMNPDEQFDEIRITTMGEEDELKGITIEYKYNDKWVSPPQMYFSESHLNGYGIAFFLASVNAFNKENKFLIFDDVISSFDTKHRKKFADLLFEYFSDYQIVLLTHETEWYQYVKQLAKRKGWLANEINWSDSRGTHLKEIPTDLKEYIEKKIKENSSEELGNAIRKYLEHLLKEICVNLEVKVAFKFNDINEKRMCDELLNELKSKITKHGSEDLKARKKIIERMVNSTIFGNLVSHDNPLVAKIDDLKSMWDDIEDFEGIFYCQHAECKKPQVSMKYYDNVENTIRCGCGKTKYDWKI